MEEQSLKQVIADFFTEEGKEISINEVLEYVETKVPGTSYSAILGQASRLARNGVLTKINAETYTKGSANLADKTRLTTDDAVFKTFETESEQQMLEAYNNPEKVHPMLNRPLTEQERIIIEINSKIVNEIELEEEYQVIKEQMKDGVILTSLFIGDPGTGKTTIARAIADYLKVPVYSQNFGINSEELDIIGGFVPDEEKGGFKWADGEFTKAFREGGIYIAEEPNYAKPGVLGVMNNALDGVGQIKLRNDEVVLRHPAFRFFGCMNVGLAGTQRMNLSFINRMKKVVKFEPMEDSKQIDIIIKESGYKNKLVVKKMVKVGNSIQQKIKNEGIDNAIISIRNLIAWATDVRYTKNIIASSKSTVIHAACMEDNEVQEEIMNDIIKPAFGSIEA